MASAIHCQNNNRPMIGILSQGITSSLDEMLPAGHNFTTYIGAVYVKWVEAAGARAVPIDVHKPELFYEIFSGINGLLIPGGAVSIRDSAYAEASQTLFQLAMAANDESEVFPVWGTCLGFEMLGSITNNLEPYLKRCNSYDQALPLSLVEGWEMSKLFAGATDQLIQEITTVPTTANFHHWCLTRENFTMFEMDKFWDILSVNQDWDGTEFVSSMEAKAYPFFGTQFHPEKNAFEWTLKYPNIPHSEEAIRVGSYFGQFLVNLARQSTHKFSSRAEEEKYLIYNYQPFYSGSQDRDFSMQQVYCF